MISEVLLQPATKLGQGYVFTRVCDSVDREGSWSLSQGVSVPGGLYPRGLCPGGSLSRGVSVWGVSVWGGLCHEDPPYGNERVVCILLECILVLRMLLVFRKDIIIDLFSIVLYDKQ